MDAIPLTLVVCGTAAGKAVVMAASIADSAGGLVGVGVVGTFAGLCAECFGVEQRGVVIADAVQVS